MVFQYTGDEQVDEHPKAAMGPADEQAKTRLEVRAAIARIKAAMGPADEQAKTRLEVQAAIERYLAYGLGAMWPYTLDRVGDPDGPPRIREELGGLMGPGYHATGYVPPPVRGVLLDDPTGDDIAADALAKGGM